MKKTVTVDSQTVAMAPWIVWGDRQGFNVEPTTDGGAMITYDDEKVASNDDGYAFVVSQLERLDKRAYQKPYGTLTYLDDVPVASDVEETDTEYSYVIYDEALMARFTSSSATDMPTVASEGRKYKVDIHHMSSFAQWSLRELAVSAKLGRAIDAASYLRANRAIRELTQKSVYFGNEEMNMTGLLDNPNVTVMPVEDGSTLNSLSGLDLFHLINSALFEIVNNSKGAHIPNRVLLPPQVARRMSEQLISTNGATTVNALSYLKEQNYVKTMAGVNVEFVQRYQLEKDVLAEHGILDGESVRILAYTKDEENLSFANPVPFRALSPQPRDFDIRVPCEGLTSGTEIKFPLSAVYIDLKISA